MQKLSRTFTVSEDELIRDQPHSGMSVTKLERLLRVGGEVLRRRARELDVALVTHIAARSPRPLDEDDVDEVPEIDLLLERLRRFHPEKMLTNREKQDERHRQADPDSARHAAAEADHR